MLNALRFRQFTHQGQDRLYRAGAGIAFAAGQRHTALDLRAAARPGLELLHSEVAESAQLMIREGSRISANVGP